MGNLVDRHSGRGDTQSGLARAADTLDVVVDAAGVVFSPSSCSHVFQYDASGNLVADTAIEPITGIERVQRYTYDGPNLISHTAWESK
ncbi:hypothetical protein [Burkholderia sp. AU45388]|uniref:hypothetical protein n=1 Tax=Burkholderia sp. AU45388 TaxID=3059206 RepID=UPI00264E8DF8|nr:hypothetical protein [Burkholderia sp. AU45388]MDN7430519.1 hypothetical protein [Burkholderia sp. AU45388]